MYQWSLTGRWYVSSNLTGLVFALLFVRRNEQQWTCFEPGPDQLRSRSLRGKLWNHFFQVPSCTAAVQYISTIPVLLQYSFSFRKFMEFELWGLTPDVKMSILFPHRGVLFSPARLESCVADTSHWGKSEDRPFRAPFSSRFDENQLEVMRVAGANHVDKVLGNDWLVVICYPHVQWCPVMSHVVQCQAATLFAIDLSSFSVGPLPLVDCLRLRLCEGARYLMNIRWSESEIGYGKIQIVVDSFKTKQA